METPDASSNLSVSSLARGRVSKVPRWLELQDEDRLVLEQDFEQHDKIFRRLT